MMVVKGRASADVSERTHLGERLASPELRGLVERMVRRRVPAGEVDDVVQTVFCDALAAANPPDDDGALRRWVAGITRHKVADFHRRGGRGREVALPDEVVGDEPPISAREWARWAEQQTEDNPEAQQTLEWAARESRGEKLAHIAEEAALPATQVRQRVSRLRRFMKRRWAAELSAVAAALVVALLIWRVVRDPDPIAPVGPDVVPETVDPRVAEAQRLRGEALAACNTGAWQRCLDGLDAARELDPKGDAAAEVVEARRLAGEALAPTKKGPTKAPTKGEIDSDTDDAQNVAPKNDAPEIDDSLSTPPPQQKIPPSSVPGPSKPVPNTKPAPVTKPAPITKPAPVKEPPPPAPTNKQSLKGKKGPTSEGDFDVQTKK